MTTTPLDYFNKTPGTLEQLVLGVITQKLINRDYIHESLATDFTTNAISYSVTADSGDNLAINGNLSLSLTFPTVPFERQILIDKASYEKRIMSINSSNIDTLSLPQNPRYPIKSVEPKLPKYLSLPTADNTLERRLMALCLYIRNYINWIDRWNNCASFWIDSTVLNVVSPKYSLIEIEADRDALLLELVDGITYKSIPLERIHIPQVYESYTTDPSTAQELITEFEKLDPSGITMLISGGGSSDPSGTGSPLSSGLLNDLQEAANDNSQNNGGFGSNQPDSGTNTSSEKPSLPNC